MTRLPLLLLVVPTIAFGSEAGRVLRCESPGVIDGDTLKACDGERIRLFGVDTPERGQPGYSEAGRHLQELTRGPIECRARTRDKYGRVVGICYSNSIDVGGQMLRDGFAVEMLKYSKGYYSAGGR